MHTFKHESLSEIDKHIRESYDYFKNGLDYHEPFLNHYLPKTGCIVDIGCGYGRIIRHFHQPNRTLIGVDIDLSILRVLKEYFPGDLVHSSGFHLPFKCECFEAYIGLGIVELDPDGGRQILREANRVLKKNGVIYLSVPYKNLVRRSTRRAMGGGWGISAFSEADIRRELTAFGFEVSLVRRSSLAHGLAVLRAISGLFKTLLSREDENSISYRILSPMVKPFANSLLVIANKKEDVDFGHEVY